MIQQHNAVGRSPSMNTATASAALLGALLGVIAIDAAAQQAFPARPIRMLVGSAPGGGLDVSARALSEPLSAALGQPVLVDNRPGAAGSLSGQILSKAPPDGHTICLGAIGNFAVNFFLYKDIGYHPLNDLAPITGIADATNILVVNPGVQASSVKDLLKLASTQKGLTYGSSGTGNAGHLAGELFAASTKTDLVHIPYKGGGRSRPACFAIRSMSSREDGGNGSSVFAPGSGNTNDRVTGAFLRSGDAGASRSAAGRHGRRGTSSARRSGRRRSAG